MRQTSDEVRRDVERIFQEAKRERGLPLLPTRAFVISDRPGVTKPHARIVRTKGHA